ncbi:MAG: PAS domain-containing sensor histidine kinase [Arcobacter sp.]|nr:PAS domain-containing sensor histidine kinase [Arcobacter sp.]
MLITAQDVTDAKKTTEMLREQKEEFEAIFKNSKDGIAIFDFTSKFLDFNDAYLNMTGFEREELLSKSCIELAVPEDVEKSKIVMEKVLQDGFVENFEKSCLVKDDKIITINMSLSLMPDKKRVIVVTKNITQNKILESQAKLASMGEMIGNIAHQWRQPLSVITTSASSVAFKQELDLITPEELIEAMAMIVRQGNYLSKTIDDFRYFIKGGKVENILNLGKLFEKTLSIVNPNLKSNYIELISNISPTLEIKGYENELMQAFINIINNAKDALISNESLEEKYIFIEAKKQDDVCEIIIKDNGGGIKSSVMDRIFEPYFTTKHQSQGTGLGLSMTHKIITELHHGTMTALNSTFEYNGKEYIGASFCIVM